MTWRILIGDEPGLGDKNNDLWGKNLPKSKISDYKKRYRALWAKHPKTAYSFAAAFLGYGKFPEGEKAIKQDPDIALSYAIMIGYDTLWEYAAEEIAKAKDVKKLSEYLEEIGRYHGVELIKKSVRDKFERALVQHQGPGLLVWYAHKMLGGRFEIAEPVIKKSPIHWEAYTRWLHEIDSTSKKPSKKTKYMPGEKDKHDII